MMEHTLTGNSDTVVGTWDSCNSYYSNVGSVRQCVSKTEMSVKSAMQGHREEDHLSKKERRLRKKLHGYQWPVGAYFVPIAYLSPFGGFACEDNFWLYKKIFSFLISDHNLLLKYF